MLALNYIWYVRLTAAVMGDIHVLDMYEVFLSSPLVSNTNLVDTQTNEALTACLPTDAASA